ncbi:MAG: rod shape-determining protein [Actinomycetota bacterium]|jgi:rod shape-determining protein MreD
MNIKARQAMIIGSAIFLAVIIELTLLSRLGLPGATPDLVVVTIVALALAYGPLPGAIAGFSAGILMGLAPPFDGVLGLEAIIFTIVGLVTGAVVDPRDRSVPVIMGMVGLSTGGVVILNAVLLAVLSGDRVVWENIPSLSLTSALYGLILAPIVVPGIGRIVRSLTPEVAVV